MKFKRFISLGYNCEVAFQLESIGYLESSFFNWLFNPKLQSLIDIIENNFTNVFRYENIAPITKNMVVDNAYNINYHSRMTSKLIKGKLIFSDEDKYRRNIYKNEKEKINHFIAKWSDITSSNDSVAYIIKLKRNSNIKLLMKLDSLLNTKYPNHKYKIICTYVSQIDSPPFFENNGNIIFFKLDFFSSESLAFAGDLFSWLDLFRKFKTENNRSISIGHYQSFYSKKLNIFLNENDNSYKSDDLYICLGVATIYAINYQYLESFQCIIEAFKLNKHSITNNVLSSILKSFLYNKNKKGNYSDLLSILSNLCEKSNQHNKSYMTNIIERLQNTQPTNLKRKGSNTTGAYFLPTSTESIIYQGGLRTRGIIKYTSPPQKPLVTIITVCLNSENTIEQTITSVHQQTYSNIEYIIIDGASIDGTKKILQKYEDHIDYFVSEPDRGLYHAMNKGLKLAAGEYILILNSDDWYTSECVESLVNAVTYSNCDFVGSLAQYLDDKGKPSHVLRSMPYNSSCMFRMPLRHETLLISSKIYDEVGGYNEEYPIIADRAMVQQLYLKGYKYYEIPLPLLSFRTTGVSNTQHEALVKERKSLLKKTFSFLDEKDIATLSEFKFIAGNTYEKICKKYISHPLLLRALRAYFEDCKQHEYKKWQDYTIDWLSYWKQSNLPIISIVLPIYNAEKSLGNTLDSLLKQTYKNFEILCINDQSPDKSEYIVDKYVKLDKRVVSFVNSKNLGHGESRNQGVNLARGLYIFHIDPDDSLPENSLNILISSILKYKSQLVKGAFARLSSDNKIREVKSPCGITTPLINTNLSLTPQLLHNTEGHWAILYDRSIAESVPYPSDLKMGQDSIFIVSILSKVQSITLIPDIIHYYHNNSESAMNVFNKRKYFDDLKWRHRAWYVLQDYGFKSTAEYLLQAYWYEPLMKKIPELLTQSDQKKLISEFHHVFDDVSLNKLTSPPKSIFIKNFFSLILNNNEEGAFNLLNKNINVQSNSNNNQNKISILTTSVSGGAGIAALRLAHSLYHLNKNINLYSLFSKEQKPLINSIKINRKIVQKPSSLIAIKQHWKKLAITPIQEEGKCKAQELYSLPYSVVDWKHLREIFKSADIVHLHWVAGLFDYTNIEKYLDKTPIVWTLHDMNPFTGGCHYSEGCVGYLNECRNCPLLSSSSDFSYTTWNIKKKAYDKISNLTIICPSEWLAKKARGSSLFRNRQVVCIPNFIPHDSFKLINKTIARQKLGLPFNKKLILFGADDVSNKRKGGKYLVDAIAILKSQFEYGNEVEGVFFGNGNLTIDIKTHNIGHISDEKHLALVYASADVFAFPSVEDNAPQTVAESLLCGTPVVAFPTGFIPDIVSHEKTGYIAHYLDVDDFAKGLDHILNQCNEKRALMHGVRCAISAKNHFNNELTYKKHMDLYESILSRSSL